MKTTPVVPNKTWSNAAGQVIHSDHFPFDVSMQCPASHPVSGQQCQYRLVGHPNTHCAMYESAPGQTAFSPWPVAPVVDVEAPDFRIVPVWQKRLMMAGAVALVCGALFFLLWLVSAQGVM
jgi:hypothetical protein